jgi:hypothetical protein
MFGISEFDEITVTHHDSVKLTNSPNMHGVNRASAREVKAHLPLDLGHHLPYTSPKGHLYLIQQPFLQPNLNMHDQKHQVLFLVDHTHSQSTNSNNTSIHNKVKDFIFN